MFRGICTVIVLGLLITAPAWAQKPAAIKTEPPAPAITAAAENPPARSQPVSPIVPPSEIKTPITSISPGEIKATPEMWFYEQYMRQYQDPKMAVRANAEFKADQRQRRLAAMHWFGFRTAGPGPAPIRCMAITRLAGHRTTPRFLINGAELDRHGISPGRQLRLYTLIKGSNKIKFRD